MKDPRQISKNQNIMSSNGNRNTLSYIIIYSHSTAIVMLTRSQESCQHKPPDPSSTHKSTQIPCCIPKQDLIKITPNSSCDGKLFRDPPWCHDCHPDTLSIGRSGLQNAILPGRFLRLRGEVLEIAAHVAASLHLHRRLFGLNRQTLLPGNSPGCR